MIGSLITGATPTLLLRLTVHIGTRRYIVAVIAISQSDAAADTLPLRLKQFNSPAVIFAGARKHKPGTSPCRNKNCPEFAIEEYSRDLTARWSVVVPLFEA